MLNQWRIVLVASLMSACSIIDAMRVETFKVAVRNEYGAEISVEYSFQGKKITQDLANAKHLVLPTINKLAYVKIHPSGAIKGMLRGGYDFPQAALEQAWHQKQKQAHDDTLLIIVSSDIKGSMTVKQIRAVAEGELKIREFGEMTQGNVLDQFPKLKKWGLDKTLTPARIVKIASWKEIVVPAGWIQRATTGEDVARYILGLPKQYNAESVKKAYAQLSLQWHPDKQKTSGMREFAQEVFPLITHANTILNQALKAKGR